MNEPNDQQNLQYLIKDYKKSDIIKKYLFDFFFLITAWIVKINRYYSKVR